MGFEVLNNLYFWIAAALLLFWAVGAYNRLVRLRSEALRTFGVLSPLLQRSADHVLATVMVAPVPAPPIPAPQAEIDDVTPPSNPTSASSGPLPASPWTGVQGAATQFTASLAVARTKPLDADAMAALSAAGVVLRMAWQRMAGECEALTGTPLVQVPLWDELGRQTDDAALQFAQAIEAYNQAIGQFPAVLLAWLVGFKKARELDMALP